jgi:hypothetical protein
MADGLLDTAKAVVAYWDSLWEVESDDPRPTESFRDELEARIHALRVQIEYRAVRLPHGPNLKRLAEDR